MVSEARPLIHCIDDEVAILELLEFSLKDTYRVELSSRAEVALEKIAKEKPSLIVLDMRMPNMDGLAFLEQLRKNRENVDIPVLFLTAFDNLDSRSNAFAHGADDFLAKPFYPDELLFRIRSRLDRFRELSETGSTENRFGSVTVSVSQMKAFADGNSLDLSPIEFKILTFLIRNTGRIVTRREVADHLWAPEKTSHRSLDPHIFSLRKKLQDSSVDLQTLYGKGFVLIEKQIA